MKPQRVYQCMNNAFGKDACYVTTIGLSQIAAAQFLHVYKPRHWINCGQAGPLGWTVPAALGVRAADPARKIIALSGDYDFQFMIEELAVGAQFKLPYLHIVVNNAYLGLIRQSQRGFDMDYCVQLGVRQHQRAGARAATASTMSRWSRAWAARRSACASRKRSTRRSSRPTSGWREHGAGGHRDHAGARHQHLHGHRDRQGRWSSRSWRASLADAPTAVARCSTRAWRRAGYDRCPNSPPI